MEKVSAERMDRTENRKKVYAFMDAHPNMDAIDRMWAFAREEVRLDRERIAKLFCMECGEDQAQNVKPVAFINGKWRHEFVEGGGDYICDAAAIWELARDGRE